MRTWPEQLRTLGEELRTLEEQEQHEELAVRALILDWILRSSSVVILTTLFLRNFSFLN